MAAGDAHDLPLALKAHDARQAAAAASSSSRGRHGLVLSRIQVINTLFPCKVLHFCDAGTGCERTIVHILKIFVYALLDAPAGPVPERKLSHFCTS